MGPCNNGREKTERTIRQRERTRQIKKYRSKSQRKGPNKKGPDKLRKNETEREKTGQTNKDRDKTINNVRKAHNNKTNPAEAG